MNFNLHRFREGMSFCGHSGQLWVPHEHRESFVRSVTSWIMVLMILIIIKTHFNFTCIHTCIITKYQNSIVFIRCTDNQILQKDIYCSNFSLICKHPVHSWFFLWFISYRCLYRRLCSRGDQLDMLHEPHLRRQLMQLLTQQ